MDSKVQPGGVVQGNLLAAGAPEESRWYRRSSRNGPGDRLREDSLGKSPTHAPGLGILAETMHILFAISIACFIALAFAVIGIAQHIRANHATKVLAAREGDRFEWALEEALHPHLLQARPSALLRQHVTPRRSLGPALVPREEMPQPVLQAIRPGTSATERKKPQASGVSGFHQRLDRAYFNKDLGDLTDPYEPPLRARAGAPPRSTNHL